MSNQPHHRDDEPPVLLYQKKRDSYEKVFRRAIATWCQENPKGITVGDASDPVKRISTQNAAGQSIVDIHLDFILQDLAAFTFMLVGLKVPLERAILNVGDHWTDSRPFVCRTGWELCSPRFSSWLSPHPNADRLWRLIERHVGRYTRCALVPVLQKQCALSEADKLIETVKKGLSRRPPRKIGRRRLLTDRDKIIQKAIRDDLVGTRYVAYLDGERLETPVTWQKDKDRPCPKSYVNAYKNPHWQQRIQDEKSKAARRMKLQLSLKQKKSDH